ncbi:MAG: GNAT family protein [Armatimonadota bacterium]
MLLGEKVRLWTLEREDLLKFYIWVNDPNVVYMAGLHPLPKSFQEVQMWYDSIMRSPNQRIFAIKTQENEHIGSIELVDIDLRCRKCEMGIFIGDPDYLDKGYGYDAVKVMLNFAFKQLNMNRVAVRVIDYNTKAMEFFKGLGFKSEGVMCQDYFANGAYYNVHIFGLLAKGWKG